MLEGVQVTQGNVLTADITGEIVRATVHWLTVHWLENWLMCE